GGGRLRPVALDGELRRRAPAPTGAGDPGRPSCPRVLRLRLGPQRADARQDPPRPPGRRSGWRRPSGVARLRPRRALPPLPAGVPLDPREPPKRLAPGSRRADRRHLRLGPGGTRPSYPVTGTSFRSGLPRIRVLAVSTTVLALAAEARARICR